MWTIQLPSGEYLDAVPALTFELNNMVFSGSDTATLPGSFSFPFDVPLNSTNLRIFGPVNNPNNAAEWPTIDGVWILAHGVRLFYGELTIRSATATTASVNIIINAVTKLKDTHITELDYEGPRTLPTNAAAHMYDTADTPDAYDYTFFPLRANQVEVAGSNWVGYANYFSENEFYIASYAIIPFVRLDYVLSRIIDLEAFGFKFENAFQIGKMERRRLYLLNNRDIRTTDGSTAPAWPTEFNLVEHLPKVTITELLKTVARIFCLGIFTNVFRRTIRLVPLSEVLQRAPASDWSQYAYGQPAFSSAESAPDYFTFKDLTTPPPEWPEAHTLTQYKTINEFIFANSYIGADGNYGYVESESAIFRVLRYYGTTYGIELEAYSVYPKYSPNNSYKVEYEHNYTPVFSTRNYHLLTDTSKWVPDNETAPTKWTFSNNASNEIGLMIYRGIQYAASWGEDYPVATSYVWNANHLNGDPIVPSKIVEGGVEVADSEISLQWFGEYGLYAQWHAQWNNMLRNGKEVTQTFILPVGVLVEFDFENKIRCGAMDYFVKKIRVVKLLQNSLVQIDCTLISII